MGGGSIIIHQAEAVRTALSSMVSAGTGDTFWNGQAQVLIDKPLSEWGKVDCMTGLCLLGTLVMATAS